MRSPTVVYKTLREGDKVEYDVIQGDKGPQADQVIVLSDGAAKADGHADGHAKMDGQASSVDGRVAGMDVHGAQYDGHIAADGHAAKLDA
jgi:hypothetical protein